MSRVIKSYEYDPEKARYITLLPDWTRREDPEKKTDSPSSLFGTGSGNLPGFEKAPPDPEGGPGSGPPGKAADALFSGNKDPSPSGLKISNAKKGEAAPGTAGKEAGTGGRPGQKDPLTPYLSPWEREAREKSGEIMREAFQNAKQVVDAAKEFRDQKVEEERRKIAAESDQEKKRGYQEGYSEGFRKGKSDGLSDGIQKGEDEGLKKSAAENQRTVEELGRMIETVEKAKTRILEKFEGDLQELAVSMARSILKKDLEIDKKAIRSIIVSAMDTYRNQEWVRIYVSGGTANVLLKADGGIAEALKEVSDSVKVVATKGMADDACLIEMPDQVIDAGVDTQLKKMRDAVCAGTEPEILPGENKASPKEEKAAGQGGR